MGTSGSCARLRFQLHRARYSSECGRPSLDFNRFFIASLCNSSRCRREGCPESPSRLVSFRLILWNSRCKNRFSGESSLRLYMTVDQLATSVKSALGPLGVEKRKPIPILKCTSGILATRRAMEEMRRIPHQVEGGCLVQRLAFCFLISPVTTCRSGNREAFA